jgi:hypothetical protein
MTVQIFEPGLNLSEAFARCWRTSISVLCNGIIVYQLVSQ